MVSTRDDRRLDRHPGRSRAACSRASSRPSCACTARRREIVRYAQAEGYLQVAEIAPCVLVEEALDPRASTPRSSRIASPPRAHASRRPTRAPRRRRAPRRDLRRAEAFLAIVQGTR